MSDQRLDTLEEKEDKWIPRVVIGGKPPAGSMWLTELEQGTIFLCGRPGELLLEEYHIVFHLDLCTKLYTNLNQEMYLWVDDRIFSSTRVLKSILV